MKMAHTEASAKIIIGDSKSQPTEEFFTSVPEDNDGSPSTSNATGSTAKMPTASSGTGFKDIGNKLRGAPIARRTSEIGDAESEKDEEIEIKFISDAVKGAHIARGGANESLYSALKSVDVLKDELETNQKKELHLVDPHGKCSFNLGMPLKSLGEDTTFKIRFYPFGSVPKSDDPNERMVKYRSYDAGDKEIVTFYINTKSNRKILFSYSLPKYIHSVCVFAFEGESFWDALCKDGRFLPALKDEEWKLVEGNDVLLSKFRVDVLLSKFRVDKYAKRTFSVKFTSNKQLSTPSQTSEHLSTKMLACRFDRVGYIYWHNKATKGSSTCFLLAGSYILTCHNVIRSIVGEGVEERDWPGIINSAAQVTFSYEGHHPPPQKNSYGIEAWFDVSDRNLDYALLKLQGKCSTFPRGLISLVSQEPYNGLVYIIGHPNGDEKTTEACTVIPFIYRLPEITHRLHEEQIVHLFSPSSFTDSLSPRVLTYDTSFFYGSAGSPVFDSSGQLVAMHAAGYAYEVNQQTRSVIEFGWLMKEICKDIERKDKALYDHLLSEDSMKKKEIFISTPCSDVFMDSEESAEACTSGGATEVEDDQSPPRKSKRLNQ